MKNRKKSLILSVKPHYAIPIVNGSKKIELRRKFPIFDEANKKIFIYASSPISKIIGECYVKKIEKLKINDLWKVSSLDAMISWDDFKKYFNGCKFGFAIYLSKNLMYENYLSLDNFLGENSCPPQSYRYCFDRVVEQ